jgi:hypothetical protein
MLKGRSLVSDEAKLNAPVKEVVDSQRSGAPEWHSLRLFGRGRRPGTFSGGTPVHDTP